MSPTVSRTLSLNPRQRRKFISSLFGLTFLASVVTVSASAILPCPVNRGRYADEGTTDGAARGGRDVMVVEKRPRRWIEETRPAQQRTLADTTCASPADANANTNTDVQS